MGDSNFWRNEITSYGADNAIARIEQLEEELLWIAAFADVRSQDESRVFARVNRGALRTIRDRALAQARGEMVPA